MPDLRVLIIDDDEDDVILTSGMLRALRTGTRYVVESAATRTQVMAHLDAGSHDVYLVDYRMGVVTGLEIATLILDRNPHSPVIMLTGMDDRDIDVQAAELGISDYLIKGGLDGRTLERSIRYAVSHQKALKALSESEARYALALAGAQDGVWDWDIEANTLYFSGRFAEVLGFEPATLPAPMHPEEWSRRVHPEDIPAIQTAMRDHLSGRSDQYEAEFRMRVIDGGYRWMLTRGTAARRPDGRAIRVTGSQSDVTERKLAELQLVHDALHDSLTGLPNRVLFQDRLDHLLKRDLRRGPSYAAAVLFLDLDRFKIVNDSLGHLHGDQLLIEVARRLQGALRPADSVARLGGDEFTVLLEDLTDFGEAECVADRILGVFSAPFVIEGRDVYLSASIGIAMVPPAATAEEVIRDADAAMYRAKSEGKGRHALFDTALHEAAVARLEIETRLRRGLETDQIGGHGLQVAYQPIASSDDGALCGFEALARWRDADGRTLTPDQFIPVAEETGLIGTLGRLVLREACRQLALWRRGGAPQLTMAVNISGRQLLESTFAAEVEAALRDHGLDPAAVHLEITETAAAADAEAVHGALQRLQEQTGVAAHLDDFGTGTASLTVLRGFPGTALKIDRSFVLSMGTDEGAFQIVRAVVDLAHELGMSVVAEGVECQWQLDLLRELRCEYCQGFLLAKPLPADAAGALLSHGFLTTA
jgi:diguanylate cyclase (GGDEF)-like protein/PAS domain S-box-containing protein